MIWRALAEAIEGLVMGWKYGDPDQPPSNGGPRKSGGKSGAEDPAADWDGHTCPDCGGELVSRGLRDEDGNPHPETPVLGCPDCSGPDGYDVDDPTREKEPAR